MDMIPSNNTVKWNVGIEGSFAHLLFLSIHYHFHNDFSPSVYFHFYYKFGPFFYFQFVRDLIHFFIKKNLVAQTYISRI